MTKLLTVMLLLFSTVAAPSGLWLGLKIDGRTLPGLRVNGRKLPRLKDPGPWLQRMASTWLDQEVLLTAGDQQLSISRRQLGLRVDIKLLRQDLLKQGRSGNPVADLRTWYLARQGKINVLWPTHLDTAKALDQLQQLKRRVDRPIRDAEVDIPNRKVVPHQEGRELDLNAALSRLYQALTDEQDRATFDVARALPPPDKRLPDGFSLETELGSYTTRFSAWGKKRNRGRNVYVAARRAGARFLRPGQVFSFNRAVGRRTRRYGYREAPVIKRGEMTDDYGGGVCQVASTIHAAALFAGLEIVEHTPHSRPSGYIPMGMDATVAWPTRDLKIKNSYTFPLALHVTTSRGGRLVAKVLGPKRPFRTTVERKILRRIGYARRQMADSTLPLGTRIVKQDGIRGYLVLRTVTIDGGPRAGTYRQRLFYPPTSRIVQMGTALWSNEAAANSLDRSAVASSRRYGELSRWPRRTIRLVQ